jgi:16S rRNA (guanine(966)-N(2))-methyltransferase RsmD
MRIISGTAKGTKLYTLEGISTRPTLDRVKESLFNIIYDDIEDASVLDLFSGSGAIGLEFASRGAKNVYLCDKSKSACEIIRKNIEKTHLEPKVKLYNLDFIKMIKEIKDEKLDIIYIDPPYKTDFIKIAVSELIKNESIKEQTLIIAETDEYEKITKQLAEIDNIRIIDKRKYGRVHILFLKKREGE